jgi:hypothetical protein
MSTTIKRVALVAVAALGLGVLSVAPSQATINADSLALSSATAAQTTAETSTATSAVATLQFLPSATTDSISVTAALLSGPSTSTALPYLELVDTASASVDGSASTAAGTQVGPNTATVVRAIAANTVTKARYKVYLGTSGTAAPTVAGTYVVKLTPAAQGSGVLLGAVAQTLTITVTTASSLDTVATSATSYLNIGETNSATSDSVVTASKSTTDSAGTTDATRKAAATISVTLKNAAAVTTTGESFTAIITSGPGILGSGAVASNVLQTTPNPTGRAIAVKAGELVQVWSDGSSGVSTISIQSALGVVLATETVTFYGDATAITAKATGAATGSIAKVGSNTGLITFDVKDAAGTAITTGKYYLVSAGTTIISNTYTQCADWNSTDGWTCDVTGVAKGTTTVYVTNRASATATTPTTEVKSGTVSVRVGSATAASIVVATDKATYAPGEKIALTVTVKDADGNAVPSATSVASVFADGGIASSYALTGDTTTATNLYSVVDGVKTYTLYAPQVVSGDIKLSWTTGTGLATANNGVAGSVTFAVVNSVADAATDAANEATDAANAATDAALAAADAADAATAAAQDASDAVAALSATVAKLVASLKAQITSLTNLVIKIQKKVKA